jgi:hypothetical protein
MSKLFSLGCDTVYTGIEVTNFSRSFGIFLEYGTIQKKVVFIDTYKKTSKFTHEDIQFPERVVFPSSKTFRIDSLITL